MTKKNKSATTQQWPADRVERRLVADLIPAARNARTHSPEQIAQLVASMKEWGWTTPALIDERDIIIAGHGRVLAAQALGWLEVPVMVASGWTDAQKRAYIIADNKLALNAGWDDGLLALELSELHELDFDLSLIGFAPGELNDLIGTPNTGVDPDEVPTAPVVPVSRTGDLWLLGPHRLLAGDSTKPADVARLMGGAKAALLWTDPPYGVSYIGRTKDALRIENDGALGLPALLAAAWAVVNSALMPGSPFYIAHPAGTLSHVFTGSVIDAGWSIHETLVWVKDSMVLGHSDYHYRHESILYGWIPGPGRSGRGKHDGSRWFGNNSETSVFEIPRPKASPDHPTGKPVELVRRQVLNSSEHGDGILDPFSGSGTTIITAEMTGRACYALEIAEIYTDASVLRWEKFTGREATLEETGETFAHVAERRKAEDRTSDTPHQPRAPKTSVHSTGIT